jgi:hypothetical protein
LDAEIEDVTKSAEEESSVDPGDGYRIWRCNGVPVGVRIHKNRPQPIGIGIREGGIAI